MMENNFNSQHQMQPAEMEDLDILLRFVKSYHQYENLAFDRKAVTATLSTLIATKDLGRIWPIKMDNSPVGYLALCFGYSIEFLGRDAFIDEFYLEPAYRNRGIGRRVLNWLGNEAPKLGLKAIHLEVARNNNHAQYLYETSGFKSREDFRLMSKVVS